MSELSIQYGCSPATGDYGSITVENLATCRLFLGNLYNQDSGVIFWRDSTYVPQIATTTTPAGLSNSVEGLLEPTEALGVVTIDTGVAIVNGYMYFSDETEDFDINANPGNANATDIIVLQWNTIAQEIRLERINGAAGSKAILTQTSSAWEIPIVEVVLDGAGQVSSIVDVRKLAVSPGTVLKIDEFVGDGVLGTATFSTIPSVFRHLRLIGQVGNPSAGNTTYNMTFNSDVGANYDYLNVTGNGATVVTSVTTGTNNIFMGQIPGTNFANYATSFTIDIPYYSSSTWYKNVVIHTNEQVTGPLYQAVRRMGVWNNANAITDIDIDVAGSDIFATDSIISLYGIV